MLRIFLAVSLRFFLTLSRGIWRAWWVWGIWNSARLTHAKRCISSNRDSHCGPYMVLTSFICRVASAKSSRISFTPTAEFRLIRARSGASNPFSEKNCRYRLCKTIAFWRRLTKILNGRFHGHTLAYSNGAGKTSTETGDVCPVITNSVKCGLEFAQCCAQTTWLQIFEKFFNVFRAQIPVSSMIKKVKGIRMRRRWFEVLQRE